MRVRRNFAWGKQPVSQHMIENQKSYLPGNRMRDVIRDNNMLLMAISRFDIGFGFGDSTIAETCEANGVDTSTFIAVCDLLSHAEADASKVSLPSLMGYLRRAHTSFLDITLPHIRHHLIEAINYSETDDVAFLLMKFFDDYVLEVKRHMEYENNVIFSYVDRLLEGQVDESFSISKFSMNHSHMAAKLNDLKDIYIYHYKQRDIARLSATLFDIIICERDLMAHFEVESRLFVPAVERLENSLRTAICCETENDGGNEVETNSQLEALGEREKGIIRCVARGLANKEIADELCLSVHTVATHRRNISAKLGIHSSAGLTIFAILNKLVDLPSVRPQ